VASTTAHFIVGAALALPALRWRPTVAVLRPWTIPIAAGILAAAPDLDLAGKRLFVIRNYGFFSHRGFFHSPFFLVLLSATLVGIVARNDSRKTFVWLWLLLAASMVTHPLLDALTDGGAGVMLALPFSRARFFFPWHPIHAAPPADNILSRAWLIRPSEIAFCVSALLIGLAELWVLRALGKDPSIRESRKTNDWRSGA
jgi:inner membrane protein